MAHCPWRNAHLRINPRLIEDFLALMSQQSMTEQMNDKRFLTIISNVIGVKDHLLTWIIANFSAHFKRSLPKLTKLAESIERLDSKLCEKFCSSRAELIVEQEIQWNNPKYPGNNPALRSAGDKNLSESVSRPFRQYFGFLFKLQNLIHPSISTNYSQNTQRSISIHSSPQRTPPSNGRNA